MRDTLIIFAVVCAIFSMVLPKLWMLSVACFMASFLFRPSGKRADGKKKTMGPFGSILDDIVIAVKMMDCPSCNKKVLKSAHNCHHCEARLIPLEPEAETEAEITEEQAGQDPALQGERPQDQGFTPSAPPQYQAEENSFATPEAATGTSPPEPEV